MGSQKSKSTFEGKADSAMLAKQNPLTTASKETLLGCLVRSNDAFNRAQGRLSVDHFSDAEAHLKLAWSVMCKVYDDINDLPTREIFMAEAQELLESADKGAHTEEDVQGLEAWIDWTFDQEVVTKVLNEKDMKWITSRLRRLLRERLTVDLHSKVISNGRVIMSLGPMLDSYVSQLANIESLNTDKVQVAFPEGWDKTVGLNLQSTGLDFLDHFLNGGAAPGEVYGLLGPFGSCKTTAAVMLLVEAARAADGIENSKTWDGITRVAFFFSYEAPANELRQRIISYAAEILRDSVEGMGADGLTTLSTCNSLKPYELKRYASKIAMGVFVGGEQERIQEVLPWLNKHLRIIDMTGNAEDNKGAGNGFIEELAAKLQTEITCENGPDIQPNVVIADYAGLMAKRYIAATNRDDSALRFLLGAIGGRATNLVANRYKVPVWLLHQLSGEANSKASGAIAKMTDSAECKSFAENLAFNIQFGVPTLEGLCQVSCTKRRRNKPLAPKVLRIVGEMNKVVEADAKYIINSMTGKIDDSSEKHGIYGGTPKTEVAAKPAPDGGDKPDVSSLKKKKKKPSGDSSLVKKN